MILNFKEAKNDLKSTTTVIFICSMAKSYLVLYYIFSDNMILKMNMIGQMISRKRKGKRSCLCWMRYWALIGACVMDRIIHLKAAGVWT